MPVAVPTCTKSSRLTTVLGFAPLTIGRQLVSTIFRYVNDALTPKLRNISRSTPKITSCVFGTP